MTHTTEWKTRVVVSEEGNITKAQASVDTTTATFTGYGMARRNPQDPQVHEIGDELAAGRALADLSRKLINEAVQEVDENEEVEPPDSEPSRRWL